MIKKIILMWIVIFVSSCHFIEPSEPFQEGTWVGETCYFEQGFIPNFSYRDNYILSYLKIVLQRDFFLDADCTKNKKMLEQKAVFHIIKINNDKNGNIQMEFMHEKSEFYSTEYENDLNSLFFCGIENWEKFQKKDATNLNCSSGPMVHFNQGEKYLVGFYFKNEALLELLSEKKEHGKRFIKVQQVERTKENNQP